MNLTAIVDLVVGAGLAMLGYSLRAEFDSADGWLAFGILLLAVLMLASAAAIAAGARWGPPLGRASSVGGLLVGGTALVVGSVLLIGGDRQDVGSGAAKATLGLLLLLVFVIPFLVHRRLSPPPS